VTLLEGKSKPSISTNDPRFYQYAWYLHWKYAAPGVIKNDEVLVAGASKPTGTARGARAAVWIRKAVHPTCSPGGVG
jgi:hypothetical protein